MKKVNIKTIKEALDTEFNKMFIHKAYIEFYFDSQHREAILKPIQRIPLVLRIKSLQQSFILNKVDHYLNGKPVFKLIYGYPLAVQSSFLQTTKTVQLKILPLDSEKVDDTIIKMKETLVNSVDNSVILEIDKIKNKKNGKKPFILETHILEKRDIEKNSSFELDTWLQTSYNNVLLRIKSLDIRIIAVWIMSIISTVFATWIVADNYFESYYRARFEGNLIIPLFKNIMRGILLLVPMIFFLV